MVEHSIQSVHYLLDFFSVSSEKLNDMPFCKQLIIDACGEANCKILNIMEHKFDPHGLTIVCILAESHCTIHTWPESNYCAIDIYGCGDVILEKAVDCFLETLTPGNYNVRLIRRGDSA